MAKPGKMNHVMAKLRKEFVGRIPEKIQQIEALWQSFCQNPSDRETVRTLYGVVHKLYGSSGTWGLTEISDLLQPFEGLLARFAETEEVPTPTQCTEIIQDLEVLNRLALEAVLEARTARKPSATFRNEKPKPFRVLLVDDATFLRKRLVIALEEAGFEVDEADNGKMAIDRARACKPDLILMDIMMPVMDGLEATRCIREDASLRQIQIIMLTTKSALKDVHKALMTGINDYMTKPVVPAFVVERVKACLKEQKKKQTPGSLNQSARAHA